MEDREKISERAYRLWEQENRPHGRELHHWEQAQRELEAETAGAISPDGDGAGGQGAASAGQAGAIATTSLDATGAERANRNGVRRRRNEDRVHA